MEIQVENSAPTPSSFFSKGFTHEHKALLMTLFIFILVAGTGSLVWARGYSDRIAPNMMVGSVMIGGMNEESATQLLQQTVDDLISTGIPVMVEGQVVQLPLATLVTTDVVEDVKFDVDSVVERAFQEKRSSNIFVDAGFLLYQIVFPTSLEIDAEINKKAVEQSVYGLFPEREVLSVNSSFVFDEVEEGLTAIAKRGTIGQEFDFETFFPLLKKELETLEMQTVPLQIVDRDPMVTLEETQAQTEEATLIVSYAPFTFTFQNQYKTTFTWTLDQKTLSGMLIPTKSKEVAVDQEKLKIFFEPIAKQIERKARDAKIEINNGRVTKFVESRDGISLDHDAVYNALLNRIDEPEFKEDITVATIIDEPLVKTGDVNDLGITEVLGFGTSSYKGSPYNRKRNIQNGVNLLNGILIPPGESFSLIDALKPFTSENGYLPELVIKGDQIKPEIGGGLCQIGTTTFRATMNSGLKITDRRNHSLVVSYYNDPSNGNPGTDATIYDPAPNYKFENDTEHHVLFQAENLTSSQELRFTFWGTNDGRKGSYNPPTVLRWIPVGEERKIETTDLKPGEEQCQYAHIGADTTFDYTVENASGEKTVTTYESHYRPLPKICLVGVEEKTEEEKAVDALDNEPITLLE